MYITGKIQAFEEELISVSRERDNFQLKFVSAETSLEEYKKQKKQFEEMNKKLSDANNTIELQKHEIEALKVIIISCIYINKSLTNSILLQHFVLKSLVKRTYLTCSSSKSVEVFNQM